MRKVITGDFGQMKVGRTLLPGIFERLEVQGEVTVDEANILAESGSSKQPHGFKDATVTASLVLPNDTNGTPYDKLQVIVRVFKQVDSSARPFIYQIVNKHTAAWGIRDVVFQGLSSSEDDRDDTIHVQLTFVEYRPAVVKTEAMAKATSSRTNIKTGFAQASSPMPAKKAPTPAVDDDNPRKR